MREVRDETSYSHELIDFARQTSKFGGGVDPASILLADHFLTHQRDLDIRGPCLEIGVKEGRYMALIATHLAADEEIVGIDPYFDHPCLKLSPMANLERHTTASSRLRMIHEDSRRVRADDLLQPGGRRYRYMHVDGNHEEHFAYPDLCLAEKVLAPGGIIVMDDYFHFSGVGVSAAMCRFFAEHPETQLVPLIANQPKFYLTTRDHVDIYTARFLERFDRGRRPIMRTTWLGMPILSCSVTGRLHDHLVSIQASTEPKPGHDEIIVDKGQRILQESACPLCGADERESLYPAAKPTFDGPRGEPAWVLHERIQVVLCRNCGLVHENPYIDTARSAQFTSPVYAINTEQSGCVDGEGKWGAHTWNALQNVLPWSSIRNVLDVGMHGGWLHTIGAQAGDLEQAVLVTPTAEAVFHAELRYPELRVEHGILDNHAETAGSFDLVSMLDAFATYANPRALLDRVWHFLRADGYVVLALSGPMMDDDASSESGSTATLSHLTRGGASVQYSPRTVKLMLETCGFELAHDLLCRAPAWDTNRGADRRIHYLVARKRRKQSQLGADDLANANEVAAAKDFVLHYCERATEAALARLTREWSGRQKRMPARITLIHDSDEFYTTWVAGRLRAHGFEVALLDAGTKSGATCAREMEDAEGHVALVCGDPDFDVADLRAQLRHTQVICGTTIPLHQAYGNWFNGEEGQRIIARAFCPALGELAVSSAMRPHDGEMPPELSRDTLRYSEKRLPTAPSWLATQLSGIAHRIAQVLVTLDDDALEHALSTWVERASRKACTGSYALTSVHPLAPARRVRDAESLTRDKRISAIRPVVQQAFLHATKDEVHELLSLATQLGADVPQRAPSDYASRGGPPLLIEIVRDALNGVLAKLAEARKRVVIFGAGQHTRWMFDHIDTNGVEIVAIVDELGSSCGSIAGHKVRPLSQLAQIDADVVLVSAPKFQVQMAEKLTPDVVGPLEVVEPYSRDFRPAVELAFTPG